MGGGGGELLYFLKNQLKQAKKQLKKMEGPASFGDYVVEVLKNPPTSKKLAHFSLLTICTFLFLATGPQAQLATLLKLIRRNFFKFCVLDHSLVSCFLNFNKDKDRARAFIYKVIPRI